MYVCVYIYTCILWTAQTFLLTGLNMWICKTFALSWRLTGPRHRLLLRKGSSICLFVCLLEPNPKNYTPPPVGREVNPLGVITHGQRHKPRAYQRQRYKPRTCQSMVNTLQVDGLARITGPSVSYSDSSSATERRPPMPCMTYWFWAGGGVALLRKKQLLKTPRRPKGVPIRFYPNKQNYFKKQLILTRFQLILTWVNHTNSYRSQSWILCVHANTLLAAKKNQWWWMDFSSPILTVTPTFWQVVSPSIITSKGSECARD